MKPDDAAIGKAAAEFRSALDAIDDRHWRAVYIDHFPRGACGHCSELLALFLLERFGITADYVCREFYSDSGDRETSHAWLEWNGLIIDISGDQFEWPAVIVTRDRGRYDLGVGEQRHPFELDPSWWSQQCLRIWSAAQPFLSDRHSD
ncbi:hypothetical protein CVO77_12330 [Sphingopyxis lindanitolerans]|uniref:Uncharacterized protein n=1 Tax=Sphingopyxis lindanitolerans TaxID=2054227 RepID=A0A2S8B0K1_9SPHN|nr:MULTISPECIES: hypothetical protein [Sphingopyxis]PQM25896.1 hypothetical protein CVO77_12330 [Sphingopyxis lindanitolerans]